MIEVNDPKVTIDKSFVSMIISSSGSSMRDSPVSGVEKGAG